MCVSTLIFKGIVSYDAFVFLHSVLSKCSNGVRVQPLFFDMPFVYLSSDIYVDCDLRMRVAYRLW